MMLAVSPYPASLDISNNYQETMMSSKSIYSIYRITNSTNSKCYIGWTSRNPNKRFKEHLNGNPDEMVISAAVEKYGQDKFYLNIMYQTLDYDHSREMEGFFIGQCNSLTESEGGWGYNIDLGGKGHKRSQATIEKHRVKMKDRPQSDEHKKKKADAIRGEKNGSVIKKKKRIEEQIANGTYKTPKQIKEEKKIEANKKDKRRQYKNIVIQDPYGNIINTPLNYMEYFNSIPLNNFMNKSINNPGLAIKGYLLISYELNDGSNIKVEFPRKTPEQIEKDNEQREKERIKKISRSKMKNNKI